MRENKIFIQVWIIIWIHVFQPLSIQLFAGVLFGDQSQVIPLLLYQINTVVRVTQRIGAHWGGEILTRAVRIVFSLARTSQLIILVVVQRFWFFIIAFIIIKLSRGVRSEIRINFLIQTQLGIAIKARK
jgi:hypothetical protein